MAVKEVWILEYGVSLQLLAFPSLQFEREGEHNFKVPSLTIPDLATAAIESGFDTLADLIIGMLGVVIWLSPNSV